MRLVMRVARVALGGLVVLSSACGAASPLPRPPEGDPVAEVAPADLFLHGVALAQRGDMIRSEQYIAAAIARGYPERKAMPVLMRVCAASSRYRQALSYAEPYLKRHPKDFALRTLVATMRLSLGNRDRAYADLLHVAEEKPDLAHAQYLLASVEERSNPTGAIERYQKYIALAPDGAHLEEAREAVRRLTLALTAPAPERIPVSGGEGPADPAQEDRRQDDAPRQSPKEGI